MSVAQHEVGNEQDKANEPQPVQPAQAQPAMPAVEGPGMVAVRALQNPAPGDVAAIVKSYPEETAAIAAHAQQTWGNQFSIEVFRADATVGQEDRIPLLTSNVASKLDADGPLPDSSGVDPAAVTAEQVAAGQTDENPLTNEVFWQLYPALRGIRLKADTPAAAEWLRLRDDYVRPALKKEKAEAKAAQKKSQGAAVQEVGDKDGQTDDLDNQSQGGAEKIRTVAKDKLSAPVDQADDAAIQALFDWTPEGQAGDRGEAAWLLAAVETGLVGAYPETCKQLAQMVSGDQWIHSMEKEPGKGHQKNVDGVKRVGSGKYDIDVGEAPILGVLCTLARSRIGDWVREGGKKRRELFKLGTLVRGDVGFGGSQHTQGNAIDLGLSSFSSAKEAVALLDGLGPGKVDRIFPDNDNHVHLTVNSGGDYELGFPFQGDFFPQAKELACAKKAAEKAHAGAAEGDTIQAEGLQKYSCHWYKATATMTGGKWVWSKPKASGGNIKKHIANGALQAVLAKLDKGIDPDGISQAAAEDGHTPDDGHDHG